MSLISAKDLAKDKFPLVYEASLYIEDSAFMSPSEVLRTIMDKYNMPYPDTTASMYSAMHYVESKLEVIYGSE